MVIGVGLQKALNKAIMWDSFSVACFSGGRYAATKTINYKAAPYGGVMRGIEKSALSVLGLW